MGRGCFLPCFCASKNRKSWRKPKTVVPSGDQSHGARETLQATSCTNHEVEKTVEPITDSKDKQEYQFDASTKKKVTFDLNVKSHKDLPTHEIKNCSEKSQNEKEETQNENQAHSDSSSTSSVFTYPPSHRYHNCASSDDEEFEDIELAEIDSNTIAQVAESSGSLFSLSIESRKQEASAPETDEREVNSPMKPIGLNLNARDRSEYVDPVLNPVENLTQWKAVKVRASTPLKDQEKENINFEEELNIPFSEEPSFKYVDSVLNPVENLTQWKAVIVRASTPLKDQKKKEKESVNFEQELSIPFSEEPCFKISNHGFNGPKKSEFNEIAVDTSLSSWLVESEKTPISRNSPKSVGNSPEEGANSSRSWQERPILGALTIEELKQLSAVSSSPRRSPSWSPEEVPLIGTVGSFWNHTGKAGTPIRGHLLASVERIKEGSGVRSTPFETRMERALDTGIAEV